MDPRNAAAPDLVANASLHAALDSIIEVEALIAQASFPSPVRPSCQRLKVLMYEVRELLIELLRARYR
jgi:hypothetical protein